jgi:hypothetical protein
VQWDSGFQNADGGVLQNHFVVVRRSGDGVSGIQFDQPAAGGRMQTGREEQGDKSQHRHQEANAFW